MCFMPLKTDYILCVLGMVLLLGTACSRSASSIAASRTEIVKKYSPAQLKEDFDLMRNIMEKIHPSLYWYTPKDSMDLIFNVYRSAIKDSMTQQQFGFSILAPVTTAVRCGHTSFSFSRKYSSGMKGVRLPSFPLYLKVYDDSMVVMANLHRKDSVLRRGVPISSIDGYSTRDLTNIMFRYMPTDGYAENINYIRLSNSFPYYHRNIFGLKKNYKVGFVDSLGEQKMISLPVYDPVADSLSRIKSDSLRIPHKLSRKDRKNEDRTLIFIKDSTTGTSSSSPGIALMTLNTFDGGSSLYGFIRRSFRLLREQNAENLVIDIRSNGGGKVNNYAKLATYLRDEKFKVADSAYAVRKGFAGYGRYFSQHFLNSLALNIFTARQKDGNYHFKYWENHWFKPQKRNFYRGNVYVIISGPTFSASTLFAHTVKNQPNITLVGEETGGGNHGNNGLMIPNITLPNTKMKVRMPIFRVIQFEHEAKDGKGVMPDVYVAPSAKATLDQVDLKMKRTFELIRERNVISSDH